jgi:FtsZ-binding cell division protein ZapB
MPHPRTYLSAPERLFLIESERDEVQRENDEVRHENDEVRRENDEVRRENDEVRCQMADLTANKQAKKIVKDSVPRPRSMKSFTPIELRRMMDLGDKNHKKDWNTIKVGS